MPGEWLTGSSWLSRFVESKASAAADTPVPRAPFVEPEASPELGSESVAWDVAAAFAYPPTKPCLTQL